MFCEEVEMIEACCFVAVFLATLLLIERELRS